MTLPAALLLAACASEPVNPAPPRPAAQGDPVCTREFPTGSSVPVTKCRTPEQIEADRAAAAETTRRMQATGANAGGTR